MAVSIDDSAASHSDGILCRSEPQLDRLRLGDHPFQGQNTPSTLNIFSL
jgi:hypothetical protein